MRLDARDGVVVLEATSGSLGTAWAVDDSHLLTVAHTVSYLGQAVECWSLQGESFEGEVVDLVDDQDPDVGLIETGRTLTPLDTGSSESLEADDTIVEVGHPGNFVGMTIGAVPREERGVGEPSERSTTTSTTGRRPTASGSTTSTPNSQRGGRILAMADDATDDPPADDADERTNTDTSTNADDREPQGPGTTTHESVWRCTGCKVRYDEHPEQCERRGGTTFERFRDL